MDILKGISLGSVICINDSIMRMAKNIQLCTPDMILMVPRMIETFARKLEEVRAAGLPAEPVRKKMFGERLQDVYKRQIYVISWTLTAIAGNIYFAYHYRRI